METVAKNESLTHRVLAENRKHSMYSLLRSTVAGFMLIVVNCTLSPNTSSGRVDGFSQVVKTLTWLNDRQIAPADERAVRAVLGVEADFVRRIPVQIEGAWADDLVWTDTTGNYQIVFARVRHANAPFTRFSFGGGFRSREAGLNAISAWLTLVDRGGVGSRAAELRESTLPVEYRLTRSGRAIRLTMSVHEIDTEWAAKIDIENEEVR